VVNLDLFCECGLEGGRVGWIENGKSLVRSKFKELL